MKSKKCTDKEKKLLIEALWMMKGTYITIRGFNGKKVDTTDIDNLIKKIEL